jgi:hypothetical protein
MSANTTLAMPAALGEKSTRICEAPASMEPMLVGLSDTPAGARAVSVRATVAAGCAGCDDAGSAPVADAAWAATGAADASPVAAVSVPEACSAADAAVFDAPGSADCAAV